MAAMVAATVSSSATQMQQGAVLPTQQQHHQPGSTASLGACRVLQGGALQSQALQCQGVSRKWTSRRRSLSLVQAVAAAESAVEASSDSSSTSSSAQKTSYHFLVANAKFMLDEEEHFQELMRERLRKFGEDGRQQDFWLVIEPTFLQAFPDYKQRLNRPAVALVSTDSVWITFMKLRLDRVLKGSFESDSIDEALSSNPVELKFDKPQKWTAPYPKYEGTWWTPFLYQPEK